MPFLPVFYSKGQGPLARDCMLALVKLFPPHQFAIERDILIGDLPPAAIAPPDARITRPAARVEDLRQCVRGISHHGRGPIVPGQVGAEIEALAVSIAYLESQIMHAAREVACAPKWRFAVQFW